MLLERLILIQQLEMRKVYCPCLQKKATTYFSLFVTKAKIKRTSVNTMVECASKNANPSKFSAQPSGKIHNSNCY